MVVPTHQKHATENTIPFRICVLNTFWLHKKRFIVNFVHFRNTKYTNYHAQCQICGNDQRLRPGFNFRLLTVWDAPSSVYENNEISVLAALNLKVKGENCEFLQEEITFFGLKFTAQGTKPDPERIANMVKVQAPKTAGEVRSFLEMANTCHEYISDYAALTSPLREITKKNTAFKWQPINQKALKN